MGGRGNSALRNSAKSADEFGGKLGTRETVDVEKKIATLLEGQPSPYNKNLTKSIVNPEYNILTKDEWSRNCALCTVATALQLRGYDVEAAPKDKTWRGVNNVFDVDYTNKNNYILPVSPDYDDEGPKALPMFKNGKKLASYQTYTKGRKVENIQTMPNDVSEATQAITEKVKSWGNGAYGEMSVSWKTHGAHSVVIYNDNGEVKIYDSQSHKKFSVLGGYLNRTNVGMTTITRLDNAPIKKSIADLDKIVKRRKKS